MNRLTSCNGYLRILMKIMDKKIYSYIKSAKRHHTYLFISEGPKGEIIKAVKLSRVRQKQFKSSIYNLAFGNWNDTTNEIDDMSRSNNYDIQKVLNTVFIIAIRFLESKPGRVLGFQGSMDSKSVALRKNQRNYVYRRLIDQNWDFLNESYLIFGIQSKKLVRYEPGIDYDGFLVRPK